MAAAQNLELTLDMVVKNQGDIATLFKQVDKLNAELKELQKITGSSEVAVRKMGQTVHKGTLPIDALSKSARQNRQAMQMAGMQIGDFATQISTGSNPVQAFNQQLGQLGYALSTSARPKLAAVGNFLAGPWSIAVLGATMVLGPMIEKLLGVADAAEEAETALQSMINRMKSAQAKANELVNGYKELTPMLAEVAAIEGRIQDKISRGLTRPDGTAMFSEKDYKRLAELREQIQVGEEALAFTLRETAGEITGNASATNKLTDATRGGASATQNAVSELAKYVEGIREASDPLREIARLEGLFEQAKAKDLLTTRELAFAQRELNKARAEALVGKGPIQDLSGQITDMRQFGIFPKKGPPGARTAEEIQRMKDEQIRAAKEIEERFTSAYEAIGNAVSEGFKGMITGAQSFGSAMKNVIQSVIDELWRLYVVQQIVGFVTSALGGVFGTGAQSTGSTGMIGGVRALGGSVSANTPYVVGEKGPELFMPGKSGTIIPNQNMPNNGGGGMVINVDARGSTDPEAVRQQVQQGILEAAPSIVAAAQNRTMNTLRRPRLAGAL